MGIKRQKSRKILDIRRAFFCAKSYDMSWTYYPSFNLDEPSLLCRSLKTVNEDVWTWAERCTPSVFKSLWFHLWGQVHVLWQRHSPSWQAFSWHTYSETYVHRLRLAAMKDLACGRSKEAGEVCWTKWQGYGALSSECPGWLRRFPFCTHMHCVGQYYSSQGGLLQVQEEHYFSGGWRPSWGDPVGSATLPMPANHDIRLPELEIIALRGPLLCPPD